MPLFKIYAGLGGGMGGAEYVETSEFQDEANAMDYAWQVAMECYDDMAGLYGLLSMEEIAEENPDEDEDYIQELYEAEAESWIDYYVEEVK